MKAFDIRALNKALAMYFSLNVPVVQSLTRRAMSALRFSLLLPLIVLVSISQGQADNTRRWTIGVGGGAGLGYRTLSRTAPSTMADVVIRSRDEQEEPRIAFGGHVGVGRQLSRRIGIEAGIGYMQLGWQYQVTISGLSFGDMIDPRRGFIYQTDDVAIPERFTSSTIFHYLDLRLGATLTLGNGRWRSVSALGVAPALLIATRIHTRNEYSDGRRTHDSREPVDTFNTFNLFPYFGTGVAFHPGGRWEWRLQPSVRYGAMRIIDTPITAHVFSGTVDLGVRFAL